MQGLGWGWEGFGFRAAAGELRRRTGAWVSLHWWVGRGSWQRLGFCAAVDGVRQRFNLRPGGTEKHHSCMNMCRVLVGVEQWMG